MIKKINMPYLVNLSGKHVVSVLVVIFSLNCPYYH